MGENLSAKKNRAMSGFSFPRNQNTDSRHHMKDHLFSLNAEPLKVIARTLGCLEKGATTKGAMVNAIENLVKLRPRQFVEALSATERLFFAECVHGGVPSDWMFLAKYGSPAPKLASYWDYHSKPGAVVAVVHQERGLAPALVPGIAEIYRSLVPAPTRPVAKTVDAPPETSDGDPVQTFCGEADVPAQLARVLRLVQSGKVKVAEGSRRPTDTSVRALREVLLQPDFDLESREEPRPYAKPDVAGPVRAHAWGVLVQQCGWAKARAGVLTLTPAGKDILGGFSPEQYKAGVEAFLGNDDFDELSRIPHIRGQSGKAKRGMSSPADRKEAVAAAVGNWAVEKWMTFKEAVRILAASGAGRQVLAPGVALSIGDALYGRIWDSPDLTIQFFRALIMESFAPLGLVEIAYTSPHRRWPEFRDGFGTSCHSFLGRYDGLLAVKLTALGAWCFGLTDDYRLPEIEKSAVFHLLPNFDLVAAAPPDPSVCAFVELIATRKGDAVWTVDAEKVLLFLEEGGSEKDVRTFLEAHTSGGIPGNVDVWLNELLRKSTSCRRAEKAMLFEWDDAAQAALVASSSDTSRLCFHAGGNRLVVPAGKLAAFKRAARKLGFILPTV
jgi:hypothetical protein